MLNKLKEYLPIASAFLLIVGAIRLIYFYSFFGINIIDYIELSEILTLSLSFLINGSLFIILFLLAFTPIVLESHLGSDPDKRPAALGVLYLFACIIYFYIYTYDVLGNYIIDFRVNLDIIIAPILIFILPYISKYLNKIKSSYFFTLFSINIEGQYVTSFIAFAGMFILCVLQTRITARDILLLKKPTLVEVKIDSIIIKSNPSYRYIGKTKNFIFFYNTKNNIADSYSLDGGKRISIQNELYWLQLGPQTTNTKKINLSPPKVGSVPAVSPLQQPETRLTQHR